MVILLFFIFEFLAFDDTWILQRRSMNIEQINYNINIDHIIIIIILLIKLIY